VSSATAVQTTQTIHTIRPCAPEEAQDVWRLVASDPVIDTNSPYLYVMAADFWRDTFLVAHDEEGRLSGYVLGVRRPDRNAVFVWQITVAEHARRQGLADKMLDAVTAAARPLGLTMLEATVAPGNEASTRLFTRFAEKHGVPCEVSEGYAGSLFPEEDSQGERLFSIGPVPQGRAGNKT
jgi:L-2,4-diaminobutyric acid acetyltransferase